MVKAVRGAISLDMDSQEELKEKVGILFSRILELNCISEEDIVSVIFSQTRDISYNPAKALRMAKGASTIPLFCTQEPVCLDFPQERMLRVLITFDADRNQSVVPVYLGTAAELRGDLNNKIHA